MNVLITGADGLIGRHLVRHLNAAGHSPIGAVRSPAKFVALFPEVPCIQVDFADDLDPAVWMPRLAEIDCVINAAGIFRERGTQSFEAIHTLTPIALFDACVRTNVRRVIQVSALGADEGAHSRFHLSKKAADDYLASLALDWTIVQPSLVYGANSPSAALFNALAAAPVIFLPGRGEQTVQPIHADDVAVAVAALLSPGAPARVRLPVVGPRPLTVREYLWELRAALRLPPTLCIPVPLFVVRAAASVSAAVLPRGKVTPDAIDMLERGNTADSHATAELLGRAPRTPRQFIEPESIPQTLRSAQLAWLLPGLRFSIAIVWIVSGIVSAFVYPAAQSYELLAHVGIVGSAAPAALYGAALLDIVFGIAIYVANRRRWLWSLQIAAILAYSAIITWALPGFWAHPFGPIVKNIPMLAVLLLLLVLDE